MQLTTLTTLSIIPPLTKSTSTGSSELGVIPVRYLETRRLADGSIAYYYCPPKAAQKALVVAPKALGKDPIIAATEAERLNALVDQWRIGGETGGIVGPVPGSIAWLVEKFEASHQFQRKRPATRTFYSGALKALCAYRLETMTLGQAPARKLTRVHVDRIYLALQKIDPVTDDPMQLPWANAIMRSARRVFNLGLRWGDVTENPFLAMGMTGTPSRETVIPREHVDLFCATAIGLGRRSMALWAMLSYELCQRAGDARTLPWSRYNGHEVQVRQSKTGALVWAPLLPDLPELKAMLDETPRVSPVIVVDERTRKPFTIFNLSKAFNQIKDAAGLPAEYQARDMRRAGLDETGDAGATDDELRALSGHRSRNVVSVYVKPNRKKAANALAKRRAHRSKQ
jgi:integrase